MYKYLFGPVPSRRLGMSLGVDLVPHKVCSLNCVYCECGETTKLTTERMEYILFDKVKEELDHFFSDNPDPDYITFSGSGEPTLNIRIGEVLDYIKKIKPDIPVALLTNGTLLNNTDLREDILKADIILPSLDAATNKAFKKINRPAEELQLDDYINGLVKLRKEFKGEIWLEVLIIPGYNDDDDNLESLFRAFKDIKADRIQLNTLDRPGSLEDLRPASRTELKSVMERWGLPNVEIISAPANRKKIRAYREDTETAILGTILRRPCTAIDLSDILGLHLNEVNKYLDVLEAEDKVETKKEERGLFYQVKKH
jgi:wyosine [tRNA(Phe)-imidazoG37] synthetase (radical SAM superfamily)